MIYIHLTVPAIVKSPLNMTFVIEMIIAKGFVRIYSHDFLY